VQLPVIFCTPDPAGVEDIIARLQESRCAVIPRPIRPESLLARVQEMTMLSSSGLPRPLVNLQRLLDEKNRLLDEKNDIRKEKEAWTADQPTWIKPARC